MFSAGPVNARGFHPGPTLSPLLTPKEGEEQATCPAPDCGSLYTDLVERTVLVYCRQVM